MTTTRTDATLDETRAEIAVLRGEWYLVETNAGTYGAQEAIRAVGTGDPRHADRQVWETVDGRRRSEGPAAGDAPGYARRVETGLSVARRRYIELRTALEERGA